MGSRVVIQVRDPPGVEAGAPPDDAMHGVTLVKEELGQVGAVLACKDTSQHQPADRIAINCHL